MTILTAQLKAKEHSYVSILSIVLNTSFSIFFMLYFSLTYMGRVYGIIISQIVIVLLLFKICKHTFSTNFSIKMLKKSFKYAIPFYPIMLLGLSQNYLDKTILSSSKGNASLAHYSVGISFANKGTIGVLTAFAACISPPSQHNKIFAPLMIWAV